MFIFFWYVLVSSFFWTYGVPHHNFRFIRDAGSQGYSEREDTTVDTTATNIAVIERRIRVAATPDSESDEQISKEARGAAGRVSENKSEYSPNPESTSNPPESGEHSTQKRASEDNGTSHVEVRATSSDESIVKPNNSSENSDSENRLHKLSGNNSVIETRDLKSSFKLRKGTAEVNDDYSGGESNACCRTKREKSCASGNINVCNHCNVYIYNKLYELPTEPCGEMLCNGGGGISDGTGSEVERVNAYNSRNPGNEQDQQYPPAEMLYVPDEASNDVERLTDHQKKKLKGAFKRPESQYVKSGQHDDEYRTTSPKPEGYANQDSTSTIENLYKRETVSLRHARNAPEVLNDNEENLLVGDNPGISDESLRSERGTSSVKMFPKSRNAKYDMKFLGLMNAQNKKTGASGEFENAPEMEMENEGNNARYDESLLQSKDAAYVENTNLFSPISEFVRRTRDINSVSNEFETPEKKLPEVRNAEYDLAFLDLMKNQQTSNHIREARNISATEANSVSTEAIIDPNDRINKIVKFLGSMKRSNSGADPFQLNNKWDSENSVSKDDHLISARSLSFEDDNFLDADNPDFDENDDESIVRLKRLQEEPKRQARITSYSENYNGLGPSDTDADLARGINNQRFDNIVKLLGSLKHAENLREVRNASNDSGMSDPENDPEDKYRESVRVEGGIESPGLSGDDVEVENAPDDVLDNANDAITVYGPGQDIALESGSTPAKQGQNSLKMIERSTDSDIEPQEILEDEADTVDSDGDVNNDRFRRSANLPDFLLAKRLKRGLKMEEEMLPEGEEDKSRIERWNAKPRNDVGMHAASAGREYQDIIDSLVHRPRGNSYVSRDEGRFHPEEGRARLHKNRFSG